MNESKLRWQRNDMGGVTLQKNGKLYWFSIADVFKAKRGERWVVRVVVRNSLTRSLEWEQYTAFTLREAMRLAKFIVGVKDGS